MKPSLDKGKQSASFSTIPDYSTYEHHWDGPKRLHVPVWQPRQTTLLVVLDGESRRLFSTARILVYYSNGALKDARSSNVWVRLALAHCHHLPNHVHFLMLHRTFNNWDQRSIRSEAKLQMHFLTRLPCRSSQSHSKLQLVKRSQPSLPLVSLSFGPQQVPRSFAAAPSMFCSNASSC